MATKLTLERFLKKAHAVHGDKYDYSSVEWTENTKSASKVAIVCPKHGKFNQRINGHLQGYGCAGCSNNKLLTRDSFINKARNVHGDRYDYSSVVWTDGTRAKSRVEITCGVHGKFTQIIANHLNDMGCIKCGGRYRHTLPSFIEKARVVHGDKYDYSPVVWTDFTVAKTKVTIGCPVHGNFKQTIDGHTSGQGCPTCKSSKGEIAITSWLVGWNIKHIREHKFVNCRNPLTNRQLPFDFWLPNHNVCIEFHGKQHYESIKFSGTVTMESARDNLQTSQYRDSLKEQYCKQNNIRLIIIPYHEIKSVDDILTTHLLTQKGQHICLNS